MSQDGSPRDKNTGSSARQKSSHFLSEFIFFNQQKTKKNFNKLKISRCRELVYGKLEIQSFCIIDSRFQLSDFSSCSKLFFLKCRNFSPSSVSWADHFSRFGALATRSRVLSHKCKSRAGVCLNKCSLTPTLPKVMIWILGSFTKIRLRNPNSDLNFRASFNWKRFSLSG